MLEYINFVFQVVEMVLVWETIQMELVVVLGMVAEGVLDCIMED